MRANASAVETSTNRAVLIAAICATVMIAQQVASKAMRDALFLSVYDVTTLPVLLTGSAIISIGVVLFMSWTLSLFSPARISPIAFAASGVLLLAEWFVASSQPKLVVLLIYIHIAVLGSVLISSFWSVINERFDPRTAKRKISRIATGATIGGLLGGILAERFACYFEIVNMLPILAVMQVTCAIFMLALKPSGKDARGTSIRKVLSGKSKAPKMESGFSVLGRVSYLRNLGLIVLLSNFAAVLLDYMFKSQVAISVEAGSSQMRFFAVFYTLISLVTFGIQTALSRRLLEKPDNIAMTISIRPGMVLLGGLALLPGMNLMTVAFVRGLEAALHSSLFRSAYELLYNPVVPSKKRTTKPIVDVGCDRLGDALGGGITRLILLLPVALVNSVLVAVVLLASGVVLLVMRSMQAGYIRALEKSLLDQDRKITDEEKRLNMIQSFSGADMGMTLNMTMTDFSIPLQSLTASQTAAGEETDSDEPASASSSTATPSPPPSDPLVNRITDLRSGDPKRVKRTLRSEESLNAQLAPFIIPLLAWDAVSTDASISLCSIAPEITGLLLDRLLDPSEEFAIRRRIPRILGTCETERAINGLLDACRDDRFEVRFRAGAALSLIRSRNRKNRINREKVFSVVLREVRVDRRVWEGRRHLLDKPNEDQKSPFLDDVLKVRTNRSMDHVFTLLSLVLPHEPLRIAYRGLQTDDINLRGTALEYLESVLPRDIRVSLWPFLEGNQTEDPAERSEEEILEDLLRSNPSIEMNLEELRKRLGENP